MIGLILLVALQNPCLAYQSLQDQYNVLQALYWKTSNLQEMDSILKLQEFIETQLTVCGTAQIQANTTELKRHSLQLEHDLKILGLKGTLRRTRWWHFCKRTQIRREIKRIEES